MSQLPPGFQLDGPAAPTPSRAPGIIQGRPKTVAPPAPPSPSTVYRTLSPQEAEQRGLDPGGVYQESATGSIKTVQAPQKSRDGGAIPVNASTAAKEKISQYVDLERALNTFQDDFAGNRAGNWAGELENQTEARFGVGTAGQSEWWADFRSTDNLIRNSLFGASLTEGEKAAYNATTVAPGMDPAKVKANLKRRSEIVRDAIAREKEFFIANGYKPEAVEVLFSPLAPRAVDGSEAGGGNEYQARLIGAYEGGATYEELDAIAAEYGLALSNVSSQEDLDRKRRAGVGFAFGEAPPEAPPPEGGEDLLASSMFGDAGRAMNAFREVSGRAATLGLSDEFAGIGGALRAALSGEDIGAGFTTAQQRSLDRNAQARAEMGPVGATAVELATGGAGGRAVQGVRAVLPAARRIAASGAPVTRNALQGALTRRAGASGAAIGATAGAAQDGTLQERGANALLGGVVGGTLGAGGQMLGNRATNRAANVSSRPDAAPSVTNRLYSDKIGGPEYGRTDAWPAYAQRNVQSQNEIDAIIRDGFMLPPSGSGRTNKYFTMTNNPNPPAGNRQGRVLRVRSENVLSSRAVRASDIEIWDNAAGAWKPLVRPTPRSAPPQGAQVQQAADDLGIDLIPAVTGGTATRMLTSGAKQGFISAQPVNKAVDRMTNQAMAAREGIADSVGPRLDAEDAGNVIRSAGQVFSERTSRIGGKLYDRVEKFGGGQQFPLTNAVAKADEWLADVGRSVQGKDGTIYKEIEKLRNSMAGGQFDVMSIPRTRDEFRALLQESNLRGTTLETAVKQILKEGEDDILRGLQASGNDRAVGAFKTASEFWQKRVDTIDNFFNPILGKNAPKSGEKVVTALEKLADPKTGNAAQLAGIMKAMPPREAASVRATVINRMGRATAGSANDTDAPTFSFDTFMTNWNNMSPRAKAAMFPSEARSALNDLAKVSQAVKEAGSSANRSNTAGAIVSQGAITGALGWFIDPLTAVGAAGGQYAIGRLLASPKFARVLAGAPKQATPQARQALSSRLGNLAQAEPTLAREIGLYQRALTANDNNAIRAVATEDENQQPR